MICPQCLKHIDDDASVCPHCHAYVASAPARKSFVFCEGCGARLAPSDRTCPKCGRPAPGILSTEAAASDLAAGKTASFPKLTDAMLEGDRGSRPARSSSVQDVLSESLDPSATNVLDRDEVERRSKGGGRRGGRKDAGDPYHPRRLVPRGALAALAAIALVCGAVAFVYLDPLGVMPGIYESVRTSARESFPSREGMGEGADAADDGTEPAEDAEDAPQTLEDRTLSDEAALAELTELYERVVAINDGDAFGDAIDSFNGWYMASSLQKRQDASRGAYEVRDELQQIIDELDEMQLTEGSAYETDRANVRQLAQWMYERIDAICASWDVSLGYPDGEHMGQHQDEILAPMREAGSSALESYYDHVTEWRPAERS